jgi:carbonic anhydrase/acetyltransferase-like protein (isoleucine patch superfamily)
MGSPAKIVREINDRDRQMLLAAAEHYQENSQRYRRELQPRG